MTNQHPDTLAAAEADRVVGEPMAPSVADEIATLRRVADTHQRTLDALVDQHGELLRALTALSARLAALEAPRRVRRAMGR